MENIERIEKWKEYNFFSYTCDKNEKKAWKYERIYRLVERKNEKNRVIICTKFYYVLII